MIYYYPTLLIYQFIKHIKNEDLLDHIKRVGTTFYKK